MKTLSPWMEIKAVIWDTVDRVTWIIIDIDWELYLQDDFDESKIAVKDLNYIKEIKSSCTIWWGCSSCEW